MTTTASSEHPSGPTKKQFKLVCKVFEVRNGRREDVKKSIGKFYGNQKCSK